MFIPSEKVLKNYASVLINFALNSGKGIKKGDTVFLAAPVVAYPLAQHVYKKILEAGGNIILNNIDDRFKRILLTNASDKQLKFFPVPFYRGLASSIDHWVRILAEEDPLYLKDVEPRKIVLHNKSIKPFRDWLDKKEDEGNFTWTLCLYGTDKMAQQAGIDIKTYWRQIEKACFLDQPNPISRWQSVYSRMRSIITKLNNMQIEKVHITGRDTDLLVTIGQKRKWLGGRGRNIPSFEIFTSPDWRGTQGKVFFDLPLYRYGNIIRDIYLEFCNGRIVKACAKQNERLLKELIKQKNADKLGEFSLTDRRFSRITRFMADTLFDENFGGRYGNFHVAIGKAYHDACAVEPSKMKVYDYKKLGFNDSVEHTDLVATTERRVTAFLYDGSSKTIYENGEFCV